jgi:hypothetical protein
MLRDKYQNYGYLRSQSYLWLRNTAAIRKHSQTGKIPLEVFSSEEKKYLLPLPDKPYDYATPIPVKLRKDSLFQYDSNRYSVPTQYYGKALTLKAYSTAIKVFCNNELICRHERCYDKYQTIKDPDHYKNEMAQRKSYENQAQVERFKTLCPEAESYLTGLIMAQTKVVYHVKKILSLEIIFGKTAVCSAIVKALDHQAFHWEYVKNILLSSSKTRNQVIITAPNKKELMDISVRELDLSQYDHLTSNVEPKDE